MNANQNFNDRPLYAFYRHHGAYALEVTTTRGFCSLNGAGGLGAWIAGGGRVKDCAMFRNPALARNFLKTIKGDLYPDEFEKMSAQLA